MTLLVPVDYSEHSLRVLGVAADLARALGTGLDVVFAWECMPDAPPGMRVTDETGRPRPLEEIVAENADQEMREFLGRAGLPPEVKVHSRVVRGNAAGAVLAALGPEHTMIVMGTHGRGGVKRWMLGSVAEKLVRSSPVPVLTFRGEE